MGVVGSDGGFFGPLDGVGDVSGDASDSGIRVRFETGLRSGTNGDGGVGPPVRRDPIRWLLSSRRFSGKPNGFGGRESLSPRGSENLFPVG